MGEPIEGVTRPSIPLAVWFAAAMWVGGCAAEWVVWSRVANVGVVIAACVVLCAIACIACWRMPSTLRSPAIPLLAGVVAGVVTGLLFWAFVDGSGERLSRAGVGPFECEVVTDPVRSEFGSSVTARIVRGESRGALVSVLLPESGEPVLLGQFIEVSGRAGLSESRDEWARRAHRAGQAARIKAWNVAVRGDASSLRGRIAPLRRRLLAAVGRIDSDGAALLQGVLLGERSRVRGTALEQDFRTTGLSHLLAVSGTHISIVAALAGGLLSSFDVPLRRRIALSLGLAGAYVLLTGAPTSSLRAFVMTMSSGLASFSGRRSDSLGGLAAAVIVLLAVRPANAFDLGFALSVSAVAGLVLFAPLAGEWARAAVNGRMRGVATALSLPIIAQVATMPVAVPAFNMVSAIGPIANALVLPAASAGLGIGVVGAVAHVVWPPIGLLAFRFAAGLFAVIVSLVRWLAALPHAAVAVGGSARIWGLACFVATAGVWAWWPHPRTRRSALRLGALAALCVALLVSGVPHTGGAEMIVLDVGQGDAILIADAGSAVLIDAGPSAAVLRQAVARVGLRDLDAVLITHPHADHDGGLEGLAGVVDVERVVLPASTADEFSGMPGRARALSGHDPILAHVGDRIRVGGWTLEVLWPPDTAGELNTNDTSLIVEATHGEFRAVLTGDAEAAPQDALHAAGLLRDCDVLKVPHHGSGEGVTQRALEIWSPTSALVSVGSDNDFGHPVPSTMRQLSLAGVRVLRTDHSGDLTVRVGDGTYRVEVGAARVRQ